MYTKIDQKKKKKIDVSYVVPGKTFIQHQQPLFIHFSEYIDVQNLKLVVKNMVKLMKTFFIENLNIVVSG